MRSPVSFAFEQLWYTVETNLNGKPATQIDKVQKKTSKRDLLLGVKGEVASGHVLAILGPSGAGKTTLLNMLTLEKKGGKPVGHIRINGQPLTLGVYNQHCAYVQQFDTLWSSLTVRDHLAYAMRLYRPQLSAAEQEEAIGKLIKEVGLLDAQHTKAGNEFMRGLSGGLKRRLSIALALAKEPSVLFLDEPTTGVDSASAVMMMAYLKQIASTESVAVLCTIHQPPASVFAGFDNTMILSMGRVAYYGKASKIGEYFASIGKPPPASTNLAEYVLDLVNKDFTAVAGVTEVLDAWEAQQGQCYGASADDAAAAGGELGARAHGASFCQQVLVLTRRSLVVACREPLAYLLRMAANLFTQIFFSVIYVKTRNLTQDQIMSKTYFVMFSLGIPMQFVLVSVFVYYHEWLSIRREVKDGMYHPAAAAISSWLVQTPMMFIYGLFALVPTYVIADLAWSTFLRAWLVYAITFWAFEGCGQAMAVAPNVILALFSFLNIYFMAFLFCGMFVDPADVIWPLRALCYIMPLGWSLESYMHAIWSYGSEYQGTTPCTPGSLTPAGLVCDQRGFYCYSQSDPTGAVCFGRTGGQILESLSAQFTIFSSDNHMARNLGYIIAFGACCRIGYLGAVVYITTFIGGEEPTTPAESKHAGRTSDGTRPAPPASETAMPIEGAGAQLDMRRGVSADTVFTFTAIAYTIVPKSILGKRGSAKHILHNASASVPSGQVLAIVGPSGAGKTTLLNTITFFKGGGYPVGELVLNGTKLTKASYLRHCVYMPREDNLWATMTPRQHLAFAYALYRPELTASGRASAIDKLLSATGMTSCQHTRAGGLLFQGLSGGQRRRLSLAIALVKEPRVIILDEPTSGLDSAAATAITKLLKSMAAACGASVICTIHQPSAAVFQTFDQVLVLSQGRVAFRGPVPSMPGYFEQLGKPLAKEANPAEAVLDLVSKDITSKADVDLVLDAWMESADRSVQVDEGSAANVLDTPSNAGCSEVLVVLRRQCALAVTDPTQYLARMCISPFVLAFFGLVYKESANAEQTQVPFRLFFLWWVLALPPCLNVISVITLSFETRSVQHEIRSGMYGPLSYAISTTLVQIPMLVVLSFLICLVAFAIGGWPWDNFVTFSLQYSANMLVFESFCQLLAAVFKNPIIGMLLYLGTWASSILFCGLVFKGTDVIWPFRSFYYVLPLKWAFNGVGYDIFMPQVWDGALPCTPGDVIATAQGNGTCASVGFYCPSATSSLSCFGYEGHHVLSTLHHTYESLDIKDDRAFDVLILLIIVGVLKFQFFGALWYTARASASPQPTGTSTKKPGKIAVVGDSAQVH